MRVTRCQTSGSVPEPMWVCSVRSVSRWRAASDFTSSRYSCQIPKLAERPPVFVRFVDPLPSPGFMRTAMEWPGAARPMASSWCSEQAFSSTPSRMCSASRVEGIWAPS